MMVTSWYVEVYNEQKRVDLFCPKCNNDRRNNEATGNAGI